MYVSPIPISSTCQKTPVCKHTCRDTPNLATGNY